jgi:hypothetical protein
VPGLLRCRSSPLKRQVTVTSPNMRVRRDIEPFPFP